MQLTYSKARYMPMSTHHPHPTTTAHLLINASTLIALLAILLCSSCKNANLITLKDENGNISESYSINADSLKHGAYTSYINGTLVEKANYLNGQKSGLRRLFHTNGTVEIEETYDKDKIVGTYKSFYYDGVLAQEATYKDGVMQGTLKTYYENGQLKEEVTMANNEENGPFKEYFKSGKLKWEGQFLNGDNEFGLLKEYNESGDIIKKMMCDSLGVCTTTWTLKSGEVNSSNN